MFRIVLSPLRAIQHARGFSSCPFQILGLKSKRRVRSNPANHSITYEQVRIAFREMALKHHPDTNSSSASGSNSSNEFTLIREAFEAIAEGPSGMAILRDEHSYMKRYDGNDNEMNVPNDGDRNNYNTFQDEQNGFLDPPVNPQILHEVADVARKMNPGGLDRGGMWQYANMIRNMAEGNGLPPLRVGGGDDTNEEVEKRLRRRRK
mmetsp:Transcript_28620/g.46914  ORF Transcript_28620/g.46914 Transcript_28620/m.46914 type:complete len:206 (-) Transcript_28620:406-1023(-)